LLFDYCAECRRCCNVDSAEPPLEITLTAEERKRLGHVCIERKCEHLGVTGCTLDESKPFSCKLYPLAYDPHTRDFYYDAECPLMPTYMSQLGDPQSEASLHLAGVRKELLELERCDPAFAQNNFAVDSDYFELRKLTRGPLAKAKSEKVEFPVHSRKVGGTIPSRATTSVGYQSWTIDNLCILSEHNEIPYYTSRWDALCPYIDVTEEMLAAAAKPFIVYALPPEGPYGVPVNDKYGLVDTSTKTFWNDPRRARKFRELDNQYRRFTYSEIVVAGRNLTVADILKLGGEHFSQCCIEDGEIAGFVDYIRDLKVLILQVHDQNGELLLTDVSILLPERDQIYGSFCQWNRSYKNRSPGIYACVLACRWAANNGYRYYNLGPVGDYNYKALFVTDYETLYGLALTEPDHPLALDPTSPLNVDFAPDQWNQVYRTSTRIRRAANSRG
jgi:hypothetical protein